MIQQSFMFNEFMHAFALKCPKQELHRRAFSIFRQECLVGASLCVLFLLSFPCKGFHAPSERCKEFSATVFLTAVTFWNDSSFKKASMQQGCVAAGPFCARNTSATSGHSCHTKTQCQGRHVTVDFKHPKHFYRDSTEMPNYVSQTDTVLSRAVFEVCYTEFSLFVKCCQSACRDLAFSVSRQF